MHDLLSNSLILLYSLVLCFHVLILVKLIPKEFVWGGRLKTDKEMYRFEAVSLLLNSVFIFMMLVYTGFIGFEINPLIMTIYFWVLTGLFFLNTIGNLLSKNKTERIVFTPLTLLLCGLNLMLALKV